MDARLPAVAQSPKERADAVLDSIFREGAIARMSCAFAQHGETRYTFVRGDGPDEAFDADTPLHVASMTKIVTSLLIVQLAEEGLLTLRDPVRRHIPLFPDDDVLILRT